jgi:hypothetical protein
MLGLNPGQLRLRHWLSDALTTRLNLIHRVLLTSKTALVTRGTRSRASFSPPSNSATTTSRFVQVNTALHIQNLISGSRTKRIGIHPTYLHKQKTIKQRFGSALVVQIQHFRSMRIWIWIQIQLSTIQLRHHHQQVRPGEHSADRIQNLISGSSSKPIRSQPTYLHKHWFRIQHFRSMRIRILIQIQLSAIQLRHHHQQVGWSRKWLFYLRVIRKWP